MVFCHVSMAVFEGVGVDVAICVSNRLIDLGGESELLDSIGRCQDGVEVRGDLLHSRTFLAINSDDESSRLKGRRCRAGLRERCGGFGQDSNLIHCRHGHHHCFDRLSLRRLARNR